MATQYLARRLKIPPGFLLAHGVRMVKVNYFGAQTWNFVPIWRQNWRSASLLCTAVFAISRIARASWSVANSVILLEVAWWRQNHLFPYGLAVLFPTNGDRFWTEGKARRKQPQESKFSINTLTFKKKIIRYIRLSCYDSYSLQHGHKEESL